MDLQWFKKPDPRNVRRVLVFVNVLLLILSTVALANQPEFKTETEALSTNGGGDKGGGGDAPIVDGPQGQVPIPGSPSEDAGAPAKSAPPPAEIQVRTGGKPPPAAPPKPGKYRYRMTVKSTRNGQPSEDSREIAFTVETLSTNEAETRQIWTVGTDEAGSSSLKYEVSWRPNEVVYLRWYSEGENGFDCDWNPDLLIGRGPLRKQLKWDAKSSCEQTMEAFSMRIDYEGTSTVAEAVSGKVEETSFDGWQIDNNVTITSTFGGRSGSQSRVGSEIFSPAHGLSVKSTTKTHSTAPDGTTYDSEETLELLSLQPA